MLREFRNFLNRGNAFDLAVGVMFGAAINKIVSSFVNDLVSPLLGILMGGINFQGQAFQIGGAIVTYGNFLQTVIDFLVTAVALFLMVKLYTRFRPAEKKVEPAPDSKEVILLEQIRDLLQESAQTYLL